MSYNLQVYYLCQYKGEIEFNALVKSKYRDRSLTEHECQFYFAQHVGVNINDVTINMMFEPEISLFLTAEVPVLIKNKE